MTLPAGWDWKMLAQLWPGWVQWVVQTFGPLPEGPVRQEDYERYRLAWEKEKQP